MSIRRASIVAMVVAVITARTISVSSLAAAAQGDCGQPLSTGSTPTATDCLFILTSGVGLQTCEPVCVCDTNGIGGVSATDALLCLNAAVGEPVTLDCPCPTSGGPVARILIQPGGALLTGVGEQVLLTAQAYDAAGSPLSGVEFTWSSNDVAAVSVDEAGLATAQIEVGSAQITASAEGVDSVPATALVAVPVSNAVIIDDGDVVVPPSLVDPNADLDLGLRFVTTLDGTTVPQVGDVIVGTGAEPIGGVVVDSALQGNGNVIVTYEVVPLDALFSRFELRQTYDLARVPFELSEDAAQLYTLEALPDGRVTATLNSSVAGEGAPPGVAGDGQAAATFNLGIFECEATATPPFTLTSNPPAVGFTTTVQLTINFVVGTPSLLDLELLRLDGQIKADFTTDVSLTSSLSAEIECEDKDFVSKTIPLPGVAFILSPTIELGPTVKIGGSVQTQTLGFGLTAEATADGYVELNCPGADLSSCSFDADYSAPSPVADYNIDVPDPNALLGLKIQPELSAGVIGSASFGLPPSWKAAQKLLGKLTVEAAVGSLGLKQSGDLAFVDTQVLDETYASNYKLEYEWEVKAGEEVEKFLEFISSAYGVSLDPSIEGGDELAKSPEATSVTADVQSFSKDQTVTFTVDLDSTTVDYPFFDYNVDQIKIYRKDVFNTITEIANATATNGQTSIDIPWTADAAGSIDAEEYYAFVTTDALPVPGIGELELKRVTASQCGDAVAIGPTGGVTLGEGTFSGQVDDNDGNTSFENFLLSQAFGLFVDLNTGELIPGDARLDARAPWFPGFIPFEIESGSITDVGGQKQIQFTTYLASNWGLPFTEDQLIFDSWAELHGSNEVTFTGTLGTRCAPCGGSIFPFPEWSGTHTLGGGTWNLTAVCD